MAYMRKRCFASVLFVFLGFSAFGNTEKQEEIDYLLFLPDSSSLFVNQEQAMVQLDNLAQYLTGRDLISGQIYVYGYAAFAVNDIEPVNLSKDRALLVINELQKRGVPQNLFSAPVGHGAVDLWGSNADEDGRSPNRRVRVVLDDKVLTPQTLKAAEPEIPVATIDKDKNVKAPIAQEISIDESAADKSKSKFPWWILLLLPLLGLIFLLFKKKKSAGDKTTEPKKAEKPTPAPVVASEPVKPIAVPAPASEPVKPIAAPAPVSEPVIPIPAPAAVSEPVKPIVTSTFTVNLEDEIRFRAYELHLRRYGHSENAYEDWCRAVLEISAKYESDGFQVYRENENWWARRFIRE